jgi:hypothetical protein
MNDMCVPSENLAASVHLLNGRGMTGTYPKAPMVAQNEMLLLARHLTRRVNQGQKEAPGGQVVPRRPEKTISLREATGLCQLGHT